MSIAYTRLDFELDPPEVNDSPQLRCEKCAAFLSWEPKATRYVVGEVGSEFIEVRHSRPCGKCGHVNDAGEYDYAEEVS